MNNTIILCPSSTLAISQYMASVSSSAVHNISKTMYICIEHLAWNATFSELWLIIVLE